MTPTGHYDTVDYGRRHVDLFTRSAERHEPDWVHWTVAVAVAADGPGPSDEVTCQVEPTLRRGSDSPVGRRPGRTLRPSGPARRSSTPGGAPVP
jgi:hypothetical protein